MNTEMKYTGQTIRYENGKKFGIYSKLTKSGVRFYRYSGLDMRFFPISQTEINQYILIND
jgi:hypothetical protein